MLALALPLLRDPSEVIELRSEALFALGQLGTSEATDAILPYLDAPEPALRAWAVYHLHIKNHQLFPRFVQALSDPDPRVRDAAGDAVGWLLHLGQLPDGPAVDPAPALSPLLRCLTDDDPGVRQSAAYALTFLPGGQVDDTLASRLEDPDSYARARVAYALASHRDPRALPALLDLVALDRDEHARETAAEALGKLGGKEARKALQKLLGQGKLRVAAAEALGELGDPGAIPHLKKAARSSKKRLREAASKALLDLAR